jgi:hypothetical protein
MYTTKRLNYFIQQSPSWEANSFQINKISPAIIWNSADHYRVHRSPTLVSMLSQLNPVLIRLTYFFKRIFNIIHHLLPGLPGDFRYSCQNFIYSSLSSDMCYVRCPSHSPWCVARSAKFEASLMRFAPNSCYFTPLRSESSPRHSVLKHMESCCYFNVRYHVSHAYKPTGKIIILYVLIFTCLDSG